MTKKSKPDDNSIVYRKFGEKVLFVLNNLSEQDDDRLEGMAVDIDALWQYQDKALAMGFTVSIKYDAHSKAWQASLVCNGVGFTNTGYAVSGRSNLGGTDALFVAMYKLFFVAKGELAQFALETKRRGRG
jgi:hypothetical protein